MVNESDATRAYSAEVHERAAGYPYDSSRGKAAPRVWFIFLQRSLLDQ
jgi:hypothetical protein